jgi:hypothetical protein
MDNLIFICILLIAALIGVAFFTLLAIIFYKLMVKRQVLRRQIVSVFVSLAIIDALIGIITTLGSSNAGIPVWGFIFYCVSMTVIGMLIAYLSRSPAVK